MKKGFTINNYLVLSSTLFGMFFGAGNLIFPVLLGQLSGKNVLMACLGFCVTGVTLPLFGIVAIGITHSTGLFELSNRINKYFAYFFTCALYLSIGPLFAIPRTATVSFATGISPYVSEKYQSLALFVFTLLFFILVLYFSLRPSKIMTWIGKFINPVFLVLLAVLIVATLLRPLGNFSNITPAGSYENNPFFTGLIEGYNTMDALASLAFGIILIDSIKILGFNEPKEVAGITIKSGILSVLLMGIIYFALGYAGAQSYFIGGVSSNGGIGLYTLSHHYFGNNGSYILAFLMIFACLKTSIGLVTSCSETFDQLFPRLGGYKRVTVIFVVFSFIIANFGLNRILEYSIPALIFLYPITMVLIFLSIIGCYKKISKFVYNATMIVTVVFALIGFLAMLPVFGNVGFIVSLFNIEKMIPFYDIGLSWFLPTAITFILSLVVDNIFYKKDN